MNENYILHYIKVIMQLLHIWMIKIHDNNPFSSLNVGAMFEIYIVKDKR